MYINFLSNESWPNFLTRDTRAINYFYTMIYQFNLIQFYDIIVEFY